MRETLQRSPAVTTPPLNTTTPSTPPDPRVPGPVRPPASPAAARDTPRWIQTLRDGSQVLIRPITRADAAEDREFIESLAPDDRRFRFLGQIAEPSDALVRALTDVDQVHDVAFAAVVAQRSRERFVGVARYSRTGDGNCGGALAVSGDWQHRGPGTAAEVLDDGVRGRISPNKLPAAR